MTPTLISPLEINNLIIETVSHPSPEEGSRSSFRNVVFSSYLDFRDVDKVHKSSESE
jgi:hypothetical protein